MSLLKTLVSPSVSRIAVRAMSGKGAGGSIREAGGSFAKKEQAQEDQYFRKKQQEQLANLHGHLEEEIKVLEGQIKQNEGELTRKKAKLAELKKSL